VWENRVLLLRIIWVLGFGVSSYEEQNNCFVFFFFFFWFCGDRERERETKRKDREERTETRGDEKRRSLKGKSGTTETQGDLIKLGARFNFFQRSVGFEETNTS
jgi:hypothetical protein